MKLRSSGKNRSPSAPSAPPDVPPLVGMLGEFFVSRGIAAYLVGGAVRDAVLGRAIKDIDVAVGAPAMELGRDLAKALDARFVLMDQQRSIVRLVVPQPGGDLLVDLNSIHDGILEDLSRRDFALDAMALPLLGGEKGLLWRDLIDPFDGMSDLREGVVRLVSRSTFEDDPARLMRAPRLAAQLRFRMTEETSREIRQHAGLVTSVAPERIREEFLKLLEEPGSTAWLRQLDGLGLLSQIIPELDDARGVTQPKEHHWDVFDHLVETPGQVERILQREGENGGFVPKLLPRFDHMVEYFAEEISDGHSRLALLKLAGLLHDIGKPASRTVEGSGRIRFLGHHTVGADMADRVLNRVRLSGRGVGLVRSMVDHHLRPGQMAQGDQMPTGRAIYRYFRDVGDAAIDTLYLNMADYLAARGPKLREPEWREYSRTIRHILNEGLQRKAPESLPKLIDGHDIMKAFSLEPGPEVGRLLDLVREATAGGDVKTPEEALGLVKACLRLGEQSA